MSNSDGGFAFPISRETEGWYEPGMTLRDYFAAKALIAISSLWKGNIGDFDNDAADLTARASYRMADAMLAARTPQESDNG